MWTSGPSAGWRPAVLDLAMDTLTLRPYQTAALDEVRERYRRGQRSQVLCLPTGAGKTAIASEVMRITAERGNRCVFLVDRAVLLHQTSEALHRFGITHGIFGAGIRDSVNERIVLAVHQTCEVAGYPSAGLYVVDEAHDIPPVVRQPHGEMVQKKSIPVRTWTYRYGRSARVLALSMTAW